MVLYPLDLMTSTPDRLAPVEQRQGSRLLGPVVHLRNLPQQDRLPAPLRNDQLGEVGRAFGPPSKPNRPLVERTIEPPHRCSEVLRLERLNHLRHAHARRFQRRRLKLDRHLALDSTHDTHLRHAAQWTGARE